MFALEHLDNGAWQFTSIHDSFDEAVKLLTCHISILEACKWRVKEVAVNARPYETQQVVPVMGLDLPES